MDYSANSVMISGHFDPFHDMHLDYIEQASCYGQVILCVVSSDKQLMAKKGKVNIPEEGRARIVDLVLSGLKNNHRVIINHVDDDTSVSKMLCSLRPSVFLRGGDKSEDDFPERAVCQEMGIRVVYVRFREDRHGSNMVWSRGEL